MVKKAERVVTADQLAGILRVELGEVERLRGLGVLVADELGAFPVLRNLQAWVLEVQRRGRSLSTRGILSDGQL